MLRHRLLMAALILGPLLGLLFADAAIGPAGVWLLPIAILVAASAADEMLTMYRGAGHMVPRWTVHLGAQAVLLSTAAPLAWTLRGEPYPLDCPLGRLGWPWATMGCSVMLVFFGEMRRYREPGGVIVNVALAVLGVAYAGLLPGFFIALRLLDGPDATPNPGWGMAALISLIFVVKWSDTGAYTVGRLIGRRPFAPLLSPKKTMEGALGGLLFGCVASVSFFLWIAPPIIGSEDPPGGWPQWLIFGALVTVAGMTGDLAESLMKRDMGVKDSSRWMPGLGGVLDVVDSLLLAAPVAYLCWVALF